MAHLSEDQQKLLSRFVLRARIVQDHSLAQDLTSLYRWSQQTVKLVVEVNVKTGEQSITAGNVELLPTEQVESAAARVRPIFLAKDKLHYNQVLDAINATLKGRANAEDEKVRVQALRTRFQNADPDFPERNEGKEWEGGSISNKQLAGAWLYGHLLHDDVKRRTFTAPLPLEEAYVAGMRTVCREVLAVVVALHLIEELQVKGWVQLPESIFIDAVTIDASSWKQPGTFAALVASKDTPLPEETSPDVQALLSSGQWRHLTDVFPVQAPASEEQENTGHS
jgi:hypothetical protein